MQERMELLAKQHWGTEEEVCSFYVFFGGTEYKENRIGKYSDVMLSITKTSL